MLCVRAKPPTLRGPPLALAVLCGLLAVQHVAGQALPAGCTGALVGVYDDSKPPHRILPVISSAGGAANPNPKACPACLPSGKTWSITDPKINCPTAANACPALDPKKMTPEVCMAACTLRPPLPATPSGSACCSAGCLSHPAPAPVPQAHRSVSSGTLGWKMATSASAAM